MNQQELRDKFFTATVAVNEEGFQKDQADKCVVIAEEYTKGKSLDFFKWQRNNFSSQPNEEELEERYNLFIKSETK